MVDTVFTRREFALVALTITVTLSMPFGVAFAAKAEGGAGGSKHKAGKENGRPSRREGGGEYQARATLPGTRTIPEYGRRETERKRDREILREATGNSVERPGEEVGRHDLGEGPQWDFVLTAFGADVPKSPNALWEAYDEASNVADALGLGKGISSLMRNPSAENISFELPRMSEILVGLAAAETVLLAKGLIAAETVAGGPLVWSAAAGVTGLLAGKAAEEGTASIMPDVSGHLEQKIRKELRTVTFLGLIASEHARRNLTTMLDSAFSKLGGKPQAVTGHERAKQDGSR